MGLFLRDLTPSKLGLKSFYRLLEASRRLLRWRPWEDAPKPQGPFEKAPKPLWRALVSLWRAFVPLGIY